MRIALIIGVVFLLAVIGVGMYVTNFTAYLGSDPQTCNNCHVMDYVYENWYHGVHARVASCNDCHTPHALIPKYLVKAQSGYHHVTAFISGNIPDAIRAKESSKKIIQDNCVRCHTQTVSALLESSMPFDRYCFDCHRTVAHGERGVALSPYQHPEENK
jgi:cytochrome c nitrite reductase small subunit